MENKFEQLLRNTLSEKESKELLDAIESDPTLKKQFEEYRDAWDLTKVLERRKLKQKVSQIKEQQSPTRNNRWVWYAAAAILILVLSYWGLQQDVSGEVMAQTYFEPYPDKFTSMGENSNTLSEAMSAYNTKNYQEAENLFDQLPEELVQNVELYKGICLYQTDKKEEAKIVFKKLKNDSTSIFNEPAFWYLSLTHLALNEKDSAITVLQEIKNDSLISFHKEDAIEIIEQLQ